MKDEKDKLTWKKVLHPHAWLGDIDRMRDLALKANYPFFCWNDLIYDTPNGRRTGMKASDVK